MSEITSTSGVVGRDDTEYDASLARMQASFVTAVRDGQEPLFTTDATGLWEAYLDNLPPDRRQHYTCHACRRFIEAFGGLVTIASDGTASPLFWDSDSAILETAKSYQAMRKLIRRSKINGVFISDAKTWGNPTTGAWHHVAVRPPVNMIHRDKFKSAFQRMAEKKEDHANVGRALGEFPMEAVAKAVNLLNSEALYRSEKVAGPANWLLKLHHDRATGKGRADNYLWLAIANAPAGFCHPRTSMVGTLLEDIAAGLDFAEASRRFAAKMSPVIYQRPQAAPSAGNIAAGEKIIDALGARESLRRRFARVEELEAVWRPTAPRASKTPSGTVFGHLIPKDDHDRAILGDITAPAQVMTWVKFGTAVLPTADAVELLIPDVGNFTAILTAAVPDAPPIIQWDSESKRNPFSQYVYQRGSPAHLWGLPPRVYHKVTAICLQPSMWYGGFDHQGSGVTFVLDGAKDSRHSGNALFPEILRTELREIKATIEAYSHAAEIEGRDEASACGIAFSKQNGVTWNAVLRVTSNGFRNLYHLDRWD